MRLLAAAVVALYFVAGVGFLAVRDLLLPRIDHYRTEIAAAIGDAIGLPVSIDALSADVSGLRPRLHLGGLQLRDREGRPALRLETVDATLAWSSLLLGRPHFHSLVLHAPELALRRAPDGRFFVAGIAIESGEPSGGLSDWLLGQREIVVRDATLAWTDEQRAAPELRLERVDFRLTHTGGRYRFGLRALPPPALASALDVRGDIASREPADPATWTGQLFLALDRADLGGWRSWADYPFELAGSGGLRAWLGFADGQPNALAANVVLDRVTARFAEALPPLQLDHVRGRLAARRTAAETTLSAHALELVTVDGLRVEPTDVDLTLRAAADGAAAGGELRANRLDVAAVSQLAAHLPFDEAARERLAGFAPRGHVDDLRVAWRGDAAQPDKWSIKARFAELGVQARGELPGLAGLSGEIDGDEQRGRFRVASRDLSLDLPRIFPESRLALAALQAEGGWARPEGRLEIAIDSASFENPDASGSLSGRYRPAPSDTGEIDLAARLTRADPEAVWRYLPKVVGDDTRTWLRQSLHGGTVPDARLRLRGRLDDFPYRKPGTGQFLVTVRVAGANLDYAPGWPAIDDIHGEVRFEGPGMRIAAERAKIYGVALGRVVADVPELDSATGEVMTIRGRANGPTSEFLRFVSDSPVSGRIDGFTDGMRAEGRGALELKLVMPLRHIADTTVKGEYRFADNRLWLVDPLPPVTEAAGTVRFTENDLAIPDARGRLFGEPMQLVAGAARDGGVSFGATGSASVQALRQIEHSPVLEHLSGTLAWQAVIEVRAAGTGVVVQSDLAGLASSLPEPMNKSAAARWPLKVTLDIPRGGERQDLRVALDGRAQLELRRRNGPQSWEIERGGLALQAPLRVGERGLTLAANLDELDVDAWRGLLDRDEPAPGAVPAEAAPGVPLTALDLRAKRATAFGHTLSGMQLVALADAGGWKGHIASVEVEGAFDWRERGEGALRARLKRLVVGTAEDEAGGTANEPLDIYEPPRRLPGLDIVAERFVLRGIDLGRFELQARNRDALWQLDALAIANADGRLTGKGQWRPGARPLTELDFRLEADDIGRFASRLGYEEAVRGGHATLTGKLGWSGAPTRIHYPSLTGRIELEARSGQFRKLEPGMGRLLGVLSLQALPRRLTLDFRDVLSEGFAFDRISGSIELNAGVMRTDDLQIRGPAARILMSGSANVENETQDLRVTVQPTLSESIALGAAAGLINPVAGVVAYVAQKALSDPIERLFAFNYAITGGWDDPKVEKLGSRPAAAKTEADQE